MAKVIVLILVLIALGVAGWLLIGRAGMTNNNSTTQAAKSTTAKQVEVSLNSLNGSKELGNAVIQEVNGKLVVRVNLKGQPQGVVQPSHIHLGSCPKPGIVKYPLTPIGNGTSETTLDTTREDLMKLGPLSINVHMSPTQMSNYVACGDIKF